MGKLVGGEYVVRREGGREREGEGGREGGREGTLVECIEGEMKGIAAVVPETSGE